MSAPVRLLHTNFTDGELSPRVKGRVDIDQYANAADTIENFLVLPAGAATMRPGTRFVVFRKVAANRVRLVNMVVSDQTAYVLEFGQGYVRFIRNRGQIVDDTNTPIELATPYQVADLRDLRIEHSLDVLYVFHVAYPPQKISRTTATTFTIAPVAWQNGPYDTENTGDVGATGSPPAATNPAAGVTTPPVTGGGTGPAGGSEGVGGAGGASGGDSGGDPGGDGGGGQGGGAEGADGANGSG